MPTQGIDANTQPSLQVNEGNYLVGIHNVTKDGAYMGGVKVNTGATLRQVAANVDIESATYPGNILGRRQMGEHYELDIEFVEQTTENLRTLLDNQAPAIGSPDINLLPLGNRNRLATMSQWCIYTEGPNGKTRRWTFFRAFVQPRGDINIGHPGEIANAPMTLVICPDRNYPTEMQFGRIDEYA